eukprot:8070989-Pyramimonas_sp.AAC.1
MPLDQVAVGHLSQQRRVQGQWPFEGLVGVWSSGPTKSSILPAGGFRQSQVNETISNLLAPISRQ